MISVDTSGQLLKASALHRIALFKVPNTHNSAAWRLELIDDNHGRKEYQQHRIERRHDFQHWLTDWVNTSEKDWQLSCGLVGSAPESGIYFQLDLFEWEDPFQFKGKSIAFDYQLFGVEFKTHKERHRLSMSTSKKQSWFLLIPASFIYGNTRAKKFSDLLNTDAYFTERGGIKDQALVDMYQEAATDRLDPVLLRLYLLSTIELLASSSCIQLPAVAPELLSQFK